MTTITRFLSGLGLLLMLVCAGSVSWAETGSDPAELSTEELELERQRLLEAMRQAQSPVRDLDLDFQIEGLPALGSTDAPLVLIELADYQCGFCRRHHQMVMPEIVRDYVETGRLRAVFVEFPVEQKHPQAIAAANAARCAQDQGRYWEMRHRLYEHPFALDPAGFSAQADAIGLDRASFDACVRDAVHEPAIRAGLTQAHTLMVRGTPTFLLGWSVEGEERVRLTRRINGAQPYALFQGEIDTLLNARSAL